MVHHLRYDKYLEFFVEKVLADVGIFEMNPVGVKEYLEVFLQIPAQRRNLPSDPLEFWRNVSRDISCPPALIPVVKSLLCFMAASTCVSIQIDATYFDRQPSRNESQHRNASSFDFVKSDLL